MVVLADITFYEISVFVHIAAAVIGFGATFAEALTFPVAMQVSNRHLPYVHRLQLAINQRLAGPALGLVLITGIYQVIDGPWDFGMFWVSAALALVIVIGALNGAYFIPTDRRLLAMVEREIAAAPPGEDVELSEEYMRRGRTEGILGGVTGLLIVVIIFLMVTKPGV